MGQTITDSFNYTVSDGSLTDTAVLTVTINGANDTPRTTGDLPNTTTVRVGSSLPLNIAKGFTDVDVGDVLLYRMSSPELNGALPSWVSLNNTTGQFNAAPPTGTIRGGFIVRFTATDSAGNLVYKDITLDVEVGSGNYNVIQGNSSSETLIGTDGQDSFEGGGGTDTMVGGLGNDYYVVDSVADKVDENTIVDGLFVQGRSDGFDSVFSSVTYTLPPEVEYLRLTGDADINGTGNDLQNRIYGNNGINILNGGGGSGDYLAGRGGDDV